MQGALLGLVGLILAFGLSLAVGRYQDRRADVVTDANTIGTTYLRAQTIAEPQRSRSLARLRSYNDLAIRVTYEIPGSAAIRATTASRAGCNAPCGDSPAKVSTHTRAIRRRASTSTV